MRRDASEAATDKCGFGWCDGKSSHVCRIEGPHANHTCSGSTCTAVTDPDLRVVENPHGGLMAVPVTPVPG
jgi:hypothetical protein